MTYEEAKLLLKRSSLSLTVLKPSVSITSSQPSLPQHNTDDEKAELISANEKIFDDLPKLFNTSGDSSSNVVVPSSLLSPVSVNHTRNSSAPLHLTTQQTDHILLTQHNRSISAIGQMSDEELKKISADLYDEVQRRQEDESKRKTLLVDFTNNIINNNEPEPKPTRNSSFIVAMKSDPVVQTPLTYPADNIVVPFRRPMSAHSSKQSVSSGSTGRYSYDVNRIAPSSPRTFCPTDPLCLDPKSSSGGHISGIGCVVNSNPISIGSRSAHGGSGSNRRKPFSGSRSLKSNPQVSIPENTAHRLSNVIPRHSTSDDGAMMIRTQQKQSLKEHLQNIGPSTAGVFDNRHYGTFPGKPNRVTSDIMTDRYTSHSSMNTSKPSSHRSFGSHGSFNSSEFSEKGNSILGHIEPVHEETSIHEETLVIDNNNFSEFSSSPSQKGGSGGGGGGGGTGGVPTSARSSGRSLGAISPRSSSGRSSRQRSSTSPNYSRSRKSPKVQRNRSPWYVNNFFLLAILCYYFLSAILGNFFITRFF